METKEIYQKLHQFVNEVTLGYKGEIDLNLLREAADRLEELESKQENLIDYNADLNNSLDKAECHIEKLEKQLAENQPEWISVEDRLPGAYGRYISYNGKDIIISYSDPVRPGLWSNEKITHWMPLPEPPKPKVPTFADVFLEKFPKAPIDDGGNPCPCVYDIFPWLRGLPCNSCAKCWSLPYFEEEGEADA